MHMTMGKALMDSPLLVALFSEIKFPNMNAFKPKPRQIEM
jgi:hypothetical protein